MLAEAKRHAMARIKEARIQRDPFPHIYVEGVFPQPFYAELQNRMPEDQYYRRLVDTGRVGNMYSPARLCLMPSDVADPDRSASDDVAFWAEVFQTFGDLEFTQLWLDVFRAEISERVVKGEVPQDVDRKDIRVRPEIFLMRDRETYALQPHTDTPFKVVSVLFYLPPDDANVHLGTTLYRPRDKAFTDEGLGELAYDQFEAIKTMPYRANSLLAFPKSSACFHGVEPLAAAQRRDVMLFDIKFASAARR